MKEKMIYKKLLLLAFVAFTFAMASFNSISAQSSENLLLTTGVGTIVGNEIKGVKDGTPMIDLVDGLTVSDLATYIVADKDKNAITDSSTVLTADMMVIVTAENGDENIYTIEIVPPYDVMVDAKKAGTPPVIDSYFEDWDEYDANPIDSVFLKEKKGILAPDSEDDLSAFYKVAWDDDNLYLFIDVTDDMLFSDPEANPWTVDGVEISILLSDTYAYRKAFDVVNFPNPISQKYIVRYNSTEWTGNNIEEDVRDKFGLKMEQYVKDDGNGNTIGWQAEMSFSWNTLKGFDDSTSFAASVGEKISVAFAVNDNDGNGRESVLRWATLANMNKGGEDFGVVKLRGSTSENLLLTTGVGTIVGNEIKGVKDGTPMIDLVDGLTVSDLATYIVADKDKNAITDSSTVLTSDMTVIVTADNGDENIYTIEIVPPYDVMVDARKAETPPVIDSYFEDWDEYDANPIDSVFLKEKKGILAPDSEDDLSAFYKVTWDDDNLYLFVDITDDILFSDPEANPWLVDGVEISILLSDTYADREAFDVVNFPNPISQKYIVRYNSTEWTGNNIEEDVRDKFGRKMEQYVKDDGNGNTIGWQAEMSFSWNTLKGYDDSTSFAAAIDEKISIAFAVNDNDGNGRESVLRWATLANMNKGGEDFGVIKLAALTSSKADSFRELKVFPNPVNDILTIEYKENIKSVQIYNALGQKVKSIPMNNSIKNISVADLNRGLYILKVIDDKGASAVQKILKE